MTLAVLVRTVPFQYSVSSAVLSAGGVAFVQAVSNGVCRVQVGPQPHRHQLAAESRLWKYNWVNCKLFLAGLGFPHSYGARAGSTRWSSDAEGMRSLTNVDAGPEHPIQKHPFEKHDVC
jgi:hypothetical protein